MKPRNNNTRGSNHSTSPSLPSKLSRIGLTLTLVALFLCSLTVSAATCKLVSGPILTEIAVGSSQTWGLDGSGNAYQYDKSTKAFNKIADLPAPLTKITVGEGKSVWALDKDGNVYQYIF